MPTGIYKRIKKVGGWKLSKKTRENISKSLIRNKRGLGFHHSTKAKKKISEWNKNKKVSKKTKEKMSRNNCRHWLGIKHTDEWKEKMSKKMSGSNGPGWKGGINPINDTVRKSSKYKTWRESVFKRDDWRCRKCKIRSGKGKRVVLHAHHIKEFADYPRLRFVINNGVTLCDKCHKKTHKNKLKRS